MLIRTEEKVWSHLCFFCSLFSKQKVGINLSSFIELTTIIIQKRSWHIRQCSQSNIRSINRNNRSRWNKFFSQILKSWYQFFTSIHLLKCPKEQNPWDSYSKQTYQQTIQINNCRTKSNLNKTEKITGCFSSSTTLHPCQWSNSLRCCILSCLSIFCMYRSFENRHKHQCHTQSKTYKNRS